MKAIITKEKFYVYRRVQRSGMTNMFRVSAVVTLSNDILTRDDCYEIMENYGKYEDEYGTVV